MQNNMLQSSGCSEVFALLKMKTCTFKNTSSVVDSGCYKCTVSAADKQSDGLRQAMFLRLEREFSWFDWHHVQRRSYCQKFLEVGRCVAKGIGELSKIGRQKLWVVVVRRYVRESYEAKTGGTAERGIRPSQVIKLFQHCTFSLLLLIRHDLWIRRCIFPWKRNSCFIWCIGINCCICTCISTTCEQRNKNGTENNCSLGPLFTLDNSSAMHSITHSVIARLWQIMETSFSVKIVIMLLFEYSSSFFHVWDTLLSLQIF